MSNLKQMTGAGILIGYEPETHPLILGFSDKVFHESISPEKNSIRIGGVSVRIGDVISAINQKDTRDLSIEQILRMLSGQNVFLSISRRNGATFTTFELALTIADDARKEINLPVFPKDKLSSSRVSKVWDYNESTGSLRAPDSGQKPEVYYRNGLSKGKEVSRSTGSTAGSNIKIGQFLLTSNNYVSIFLLIVLIVFSTGLYQSRQTVSDWINSLRLPFLESNRSMPLETPRVNSSKKDWAEPLPDTTKLGGSPLDIKQGGSENIKSSSYNVHEEPPFKPGEYNDLELVGIIEDTLKLIQDEGFPISPVSISLLDLSNDICCAYAGYQDKERRFPASIVKLFWITMLYGQYKSGLLEEGDLISSNDEVKAIHDSDNNAASRILDVITDTKSTMEKLDQDALNNWFLKRMTVNEYFRSAGYQNVNLIQKTFPIPDLELPFPLGAGDQIRGIATDEKDKGQSPVRNYLTTFSAARILYEIDNGLAISKNYSNRIKQLLLHDHSPEAWEDITYSSIEGYFGESLPETAHIYTKVGYTRDDGRQEAAIISSQDKRTRYILVVFANDRIFSDDRDPDLYARNSKIFPKISGLVYSRMRDRN